jgi:hypothetical protein
MTWQPINLAKIADKPPVEPTIGSGNLIYPGARHLFSGEPESAKTIAAYAILLETIRSGRDVLLADWEMGPDLAKQRLREMGATDDDLERLHYVEPDRAPTADDYHQFSHVGLAAFDASAGAYDVAGLDDNARKDVERFAATYIRPLWHAGVATILLDHVVKAKDNRGRYSIGSERKMGGVDVHLGFEVVKRISRGHDGLARIVTHKDRFGFLARPRAGELELRSDPDTHAITWTFQPASEETDNTDDWRPTALMEKVSNYLRRQQAPVSRSTISRDVTGKREYLLTAIDHLVRDGYAAETPGDRKAKLVTYLHPFPPVPDPFPPVPGNGSPDQFPVPPLSRGERERVDLALERDNQ